MADSEEALVLTDDSVTEMLRDYMGRGVYDDGQNIDLQEVQLPQAGSSSPATVRLVIKIYQVEVTARLTFPIIRGELPDGYTADVTVQQRYYDLGVYDAHSDEGWPKLTSAVNELLKQHFGSLLESVDGLQQLHREFEFNRIRLQYPLIDWLIRRLERIAGRKITPLLAQK